MCRAGFARTFASYMQHQLKPRKSRTTQRVLSCRQGKTLRALCAASVESCCNVDVVGQRARPREREREREREAEREGGQRGESQRAKQKEMRSPVALPTNRTTSQRFAVGRRCPLKLAPRALPRLERTTAKRLRGTTASRNYPRGWLSHARDPWHDPLNEQMLAIPNLLPGPKHPTANFSAESSGPE